MIVSKTKRNTNKAINPNIIYLVKDASLTKYNAPKEAMIININTKDSANINPPLPILETTLQEYINITLSTLLTSPLTH